MSEWKSRTFPSEALIKKKKKKKKILAKEAVNRCPRGTNTYLPRRQ